MEIAASKRQVHRGPGPDVQPEDQRMGAVLPDATIVHGYAAYLLHSTICWCGGPAGNTRGFAEIGLAATSGFIGCCRRAPTLWAHWEIRAKASIA